jgi:hypothetical protein
MSPDPNTTSRIDFTDFFMRFQHAPDAHPLYKHFFVTHQQLAKLLIEHPAMQPNLQQTFSTPANSKNKVYFMWDFVLRTFQNLVAQVDPRADKLDNVPIGCAACGKEKRDDGKKLLVCARCKAETYCSTECQKKRWKSHKRKCEPA